MDLRQPAVPAQKSSIVLFGFMGVGKSRVARTLARWCGFRLRDTDAMIEACTGMSVRAIFERRGEEAFRRMERRIVSQVARERGCVIATGGGVALHGPSVAALAVHGHLFLLVASPHTIAGRVAPAPGVRPLLGGSAAPAVRALLRARARFYARIPNRIGTDERTPDEVARTVLSRYRTLGGLLPR